MAHATALPSGTVTFLFTDIEGSTRLLKALGRDHYSELLDTHDRLLRTAFAEHEGVEIDRQGDSFFAVFPSAGAAVRAAAAAQRRLAAQEWPQAAHVRVRMGLHTGEAALREGGYVGVAVHWAARVGAAAAGGQILLSSTTTKLVEQELPVAGRLVDLGERRLPGLDHPERLFALELEGLPDSAAPLRSRVRRDIAPADRTLLERDAELGALEALIAAARQGDGRLAAVEGSAGIGKTRLLTEARPLAVSAGFEVLTARAGELEGDFAFGIVRQLFEPALAAAPSEVRGELFSGAAELAAPLFALAGAPGDGAAPEDSFTMLHGLYWLAANFALRQPTMLVVDDLHWADEPSLRWLSYLAHRLEGLPLLLLVGSRPPEQAQTPTLVAEILADPLATVIRPAALGERSAVTLAQELFGIDPDTEFAAVLCRVSGGNPLYLAAVLDTVAREEIEPTAANAHRLLALAGDAVSRGVGLRLSRLAAEAIALVRAAAILGDGADLRHAAALAELEVETAGRAASQLVDSDLLRHENPLEFIHPVVRTAIYQHMSEGDRLSGHRRAAQTLLDAGLPAEQAAAHLQLTLPAGDGFVVATLREAAERSHSQGAPDAAIAYLRRALEEPPAPEDRPDVLGELGMAETEAFQSAASAEHLRQALAHFEDVASRPDLVLAYVKALSTEAASTREAFDLLEELSDRSRGDRGLQEQVEAQLMIAAHYDPELYPAARHGWDALSERDADQPIQAGELLALGAFEEARRGVDRERTVELARRAVASGVTNTRERLYFVNALYALTLAGQFEEAATALDDGVEHSRRAGDRVAAAAFCLWAGRLRIERGELLAAEEFLGAPEAVSFGELPLPFAYRAAFLAEALLPRGETAEVEVLFAKVRLEDVLVGHRIFCLYSRGHFYLDTGRPEQALTDLRTAGEIAESIGIENPAFAPWRSQAALALYRLGRADEARELGCEELERSRRWGALRTIGVSLRALGAVEGDATGQDRLREAVEVLAQTPAQLEHAGALIDLGAALRRANSRSEARKHLRAGVEIAHQCGALALAERANEELAATGARKRTILYTGLDTLTASERRVAQMAAEGASNKEIAQALFVTVKTVEMHLGRVYRKLEISSRAQLAGALGRSAAEVGQLPSTA
jgi:class 3 adenylate cyclase/DNA-binding CsgD family transcriptional regulator